MFDNIENFGVYGNKDQNGKIKYKFGSKIRNKTMPTVETAIAAYCKINRDTDSSLQDKNTKITNNKSIKDKNNIPLDPSVNPKWNEGILEGIIGGKNTYINMQDKISNDIINMYKDIYLHDIGGLVVDLITKIIISNNYELVMDDIDGINEAEVIKDVLSTYPEDIPNLLTDTAIDYLVFGKFIGMMHYNKERNKVLIRRLMPEAVSVYNPNLLGEPAIIHVDKTKTTSFADSTLNTRIDKVLEDAGFEVKEDGILDDDETLQIFRGKYLPNVGNSYFNRILHIYLLEKTLYKGTVEKARRRQAPLLHITIDQDSSQVTMDQLTQLARMATQADQDPINGVIATSSVVKFNEVKSMNSMWKWTDVNDNLYTTKLKFLGINPAILSSGATINTTETSLDFLNSTVNSIIDDLTTSISTKLNTYIVHNIYTNWDEATNNAQINLTYSSNEKDNTDEVAKTIDNLTKLGLPISLTQLIAASATNINEIANFLEADKEIVKNIANKRKEVLQTLQEDDLLKYVPTELLKTLGIDEDLITQVKNGSLVIPPSNENRDAIGIKQGTKDKLKTSIEQLQSLKIKEDLDKSMIEASKMPENNIQKRNEITGQLEDISVTEKKKLEEKYIKKLVKAREGLKKVTNSIKEGK